MICLTVMTGGKFRNRSRPVSFFAIRQEWWTGEALPEVTVVRRELTGMPKIEVVGRSKEKVEEIFWETVTQTAPSWPESRGNSFHYFVRQTERSGHIGSTFPLWCVMMTAWTDTPWNGSATTS